MISKNEPALAATLDALAEQLEDVVPRLVEWGEILVVDASSGALGAIRAARPDVRWVDFVPPSGARVTIPHQRNRGVAEARGDIIVFTDCGCVPAEAWLGRLLDPILEAGERITCGRTGASGAVDPYRAV
ncbi:MAG TPA: glycosyltransferase, partial [Acidimicrobiales bacterium]|nr:glycosyltransferase [Acidimicrobiales bacterium]